MALRNGIDTTAYLTHGVYSETYGAADTENIASLFVSLGLLELAPEVSIGGAWRLHNWFWEFF